MPEEMQGGQCPVATRDITINLQNRGKAIDKANYGPMNPREPNDRYWQQLAAKWDVPVEEAKTMRCGNCAAFNQTERMMDCIAQGLGGEGMADDPMETIEAGDLGFCEIFDFKCAAERTCDAWIVGGPITDEEEGDEYGEDEEGSAEDESYNEED
jgi:hypothetical protein